MAGTLCIGPPSKGKDIVSCSGLRNIPPNVVHALTPLMYSKANRKCDIAVQKNNLNEEIEQQPLLQELIGKFLFSIEHKQIIILSSD